MPSPTQFSSQSWLLSLEDLRYQPTNERTKAIYRLLLRFIGRQLKDQHESIIKGAADEILDVMKNPNLNEEARRSEILELLPSESLDDDDYNELSNMCKKIDDWDPHQAKDDVGEDETLAVNVVMDDESDDDNLSEVAWSEDDIDDAESKNGTEAETRLLEDLARRNQIEIVPRVEMSEPIRKEGYQEYHIAPMKPPTKNQNVIKIRSLPEIERKAFGDIKELNPIQSEIYETAIKTSKNLLICAPTGAGKTNIAIMTILREALKYGRETESGEWVFSKDDFKVIYVAPIKALVQEVVENFRGRLGVAPYNFAVEELTGDHQLNQRQISRSQIIVCTPEKWDIVTRKSIDRLYTKVVRLVIFDEIHLLHNERGATLEALIVRIKRHRMMEGEKIRILGLSATLPNYKDVSRFIAPDSPESSTFYFGSKHRPIPLRQQYIAMAKSKRAYKLVDEIVYEKVLEKLAENAQILIFVHSRPGTAKTADYIKTRAVDEQKVGLFLSDESAREQIQEVGQNLRGKLHELLKFGIGIHHAGLNKDERSCVEDLFRQRFIKVLVSTATLAWGVNLPARVVIIKGTQVYRDGKLTDLDSLDVTQMLGRAGRPGFDREGEGIVITDQSTVQFYMSLMTEQLPVESRLIGRLAEFINAECVGGNIESLEDAIDWIRETYLYSRMLSVLKQDDNRQYLSLYGIDPGAREKDPELSAHRRNLAYAAASILDNRGLILFDRTSGLMKSTELGRIASHYNCSSRTMKTFNDEIKEYTTDTDLFRIFSLAEEFNDMRVKDGDVLDLQTLFNQVPFPIDDKRATPGANKVNALLQVYIFRLNIDGSDLICEMHFIKDNAARLARAIFEVVLMKGYAQVAELALDFCRKIDKRMTVCHSVLRQFADDLDPNILSRLEKRNYHVDELRVLKADKITELLRCDRRDGERVARLLGYLPKFDLKATSRPVSRDALKIDLSIKTNFKWSETHHGYSQRFWLFVEDTNQEVILHNEIIYIRRFDSDGQTVSTSFVVPYLRPAHPGYFIRLFADNWFGCDHRLWLPIEGLSLPDEEAIKTELMDIHAQSIRSVDHPQFEREYARQQISSLNQIQTQVFEQIKNMDRDLILLAPAGSGKTLCAELAIIQCLRIYGDTAKGGYVAANPDSARRVMDKWMHIFGEQEVALLTGNYRLDAVRVSNQRVQVVIGDPKSWHVLTLMRSKKYRNLLNKFQLFVIDDIHRLHDDADSTLEWLCSKLRIITKQNPDSPARFVVLGSPISSAVSLRRWFAFEKGKNEPKVFNFSPRTRPVRLELICQKYHPFDYKMRIMAMQRPVYRAIINHAKDRPVIIFVSDQQRAQDVCENIISHARRDSILLARSSKKPDIHDRDLRDCIKYGGAYIYKGMHPEDLKIVEALYERGDIQVLVATVAMCWSIPCRSYLTIIMDTQHHNGVEAQDYPLTDVIQMVGLSGRPLLDHECKCIIMCHNSKADHYERSLREPLLIESELPINLVNHVNYEVATGALTDLNMIYKPYLAQTFFHKRISVNPNYYVDTMFTEDDEKQKLDALVNYFNELTNNVASDLRKYEFLSMEGSQEEFSAGLLSKISLEYYISFETLSNYEKHLSSSSSISELIQIISIYTSEFKSIPIRNGELSDLKRLQRRHRPSEGSYLSEHYFKIKLLILSQYQKTDGKEDSVSGELIEDRRHIITVCHRLLMAIIDVAWLKDSFSLAKSCLQLCKKVAPFNRSTRPNLEMDSSLSKSDDFVNLEVTVVREDEPFSMDEFSDLRLPDYMYREEGWCFLIHGRPKSKKDAEKFVLFRRVKTPTRGTNSYKLDFALTENALAYSYDLYFMSDFYSTREDRKIPDINIEE